MTNTVTADTFPIMDTKYKVYLFEKENREAVKVEEYRFFGDAEEYVKKIVTGKNPVSTIDKVSI